jgi:peptide deformylase
LTPSPFLFKEFELEIKLSQDKSRLLQKGEKWDFSNPPMDIVELSESMVKTMLAKNGLGLAYNQTNLPDNFSIFAMRGSPENFIIINPRIIQPSEEMIELDEGCLSFPNLIFHISRPRHIRMRFQAPNGETFTKTFTDMTARIVQHEMCHLEGKPFWTGLSKLKFDRDVRKAYKRGFDYRGLTYKGS